MIRNRFAHLVVESAISHVGLFRVPCDDFPNSYYSPSIYINQVMFLIKQAIPLLTILKIDCAVKRVVHPPARSEKAHLQSSFADHITGHLGQQIVDLRRNASQSYQERNRPYSE